jgi:hypothetical protein
VATTQTMRTCPWCGSSVRLAHCPVVATNLAGADGSGLSGGGSLDAMASGLGGGEFSLGELGGGELGIGVAPAMEEVTAPAAAAAAERPVPVSGARVLGYAGEWPIVAAPQLDPARSSAFVDMFRRALKPIATQADPRDVPARACVACHHPLPTDIDDRDVIIISVLGINRAGKTYLLATALAEALHRGALQAAGVTGFSADEATSGRFHRDYYLPVFRLRHRLDQTQDPADGDAVEPLIFRFEVGGTPYILALHDLAGEAIADHRRRAVVAPFVRHSDALLFVVDPLEIEELRRALPVEQVTVDWRSWEQADVLRGCIDTLGDRAPSVPVSVVVTKSDLVSLAEDRQFAFSKDADGTDWAADQEKVDQEVRQLLRQRGAGGFEDAAGRAGRGYFHAVSAFGEAPSSPASPGVVHPVRVAEPFGMLIRLVAEARSRR